MTRTFTGTLRLQLVCLTAFLAILRFLAVECGSILHQLQLPKFLVKLPEWQFKFAPLIDRATLIAATVVLILLIPKLIQTKRGQEKSKLDESLALSFLLFLGILAINSLSKSSWSLGLAHGTLTFIFLLSALRLAKSPLSHRHRWPLLALTLFSAIPLIWRILLDLGLGAGSSPLELVRNIADTTVILSWAALVLAINPPRARPMAFLPLAVGGVLLWLAITSFDDFRHVLSSVTGLWYTTFAPLPIKILVPTAAISLMAIAVGKRQGTMAIGLIIIAGAAHRSGQVTAIVLQALGLLFLLVYARRKKHQEGDLYRLLS